MPRNWKEGPIWSSAVICTYLYPLRHLLTYLVLADDPWGSLLCHPLFLCYRPLQVQPVAVPSAPFSRSQNHQLPSHSRAQVTIVRPGHLDHHNIIWGSNSSLSGAHPGKVACGHGYDAYCCLPPLTLPSSCFLPWETLLGELGSDTERGQNAAPVPSFLMSTLGSQWQITPMPCIRITW